MNERETIIFLDFANKISNICRMNNQVTTSIKQIKIGPEVIVINGVKGDSELYRIVINNTFKGYIQKRDGEFHRLDGSDIHNLIFARICQEMEN